jgi:sporulation protein YlmC with PRC-barrel domain
MKITKLKHAETLQGLLFAAILIAALVLPFMANSEESHNAQPTTDGVHWAYQASELIGSRVVNRKDQVLGEIDDLVFTKDGSITYFVLGSGGVLGFNETKTLVPWTVLNLQADVIRPQEQGLVADLTQHDLAMAPMLTTEDLQNIANPRLKADIQHYYKVTKEGASATSTTTPSTTTSSQWMEEFDRIDIDNNNTIGKKEARESNQSTLVDEFSSVDTDNNGQISRGEYSKYRVEG